MRRGGGAHSGAAEEWARVARRQRRGCERKQRRGREPCGEGDRVVLQCLHVMSNRPMFIYCRHWHAWNRRCIGCCSVLATPPLTAGPEGVGPPRCPRPPPCGGLWVAAGCLPSARCVRAAGR